MRISVLTIVLEVSVDAKMNTRLLTTLSPSSFKEVYRYRPICFVYH